MAEPPKKTEFRVKRIIRDTNSTRSLKELYNHQCQVCGLAIAISGSLRYSEVHHIRPLGGQHKGPDTTDNMLVLCPNHHAMFDLGIPRFRDAKTIEIKGVLTKLRLNHSLSHEVIEYHNALWDSDISE